MGRRDTIIREIRQRDICYLLHFTQSTNIPGIARHGLLSRRGIGERDGIVATPSAAGRYDENDGAISVSVSTFYPKMFDRKRRDNPGADWTFLALDPEILWRLECHFFAYGASKWRSDRHKPGTTSAFMRLFEDRVPAGYRHASGIPDHVPTYPGAEVQVLEDVPLEFILGAFPASVVEANWLDAQFAAKPGPDFVTFRTPGHVLHEVGVQRWGYPHPADAPVAAPRTDLDDLYEACAHEDGEPAYLGDGVYLDPPGS